MTVPFSKTLTAIHLEKRASSLIWIGATTFILLAWFAWFSLFPVSIYSVSDTARVEVRSDILPLHAPVDGRIAKINIRLGDKIEIEEVLIELDSQIQQIQLDDAKGQLAAIVLEQQAMQKEIEVTLFGVEHESDQTLAQLESAHAHLEDARIRAQHATDHLQRIDDLYRKGSVSEIEFNTASSEAKQFISQVQAQSGEIDLINKTSRAKQNERQTRVQRLQTELARLNRDRVALETRQRRLEYEVSRRVIRAPINGKIGQIEDLYVGMEVEEGDRLAVFVPADGLEVEAYFRPDQAFGRITEGQHGRLTFDGFPWTQYGSGEVEVVHLAEELKNGLVQVRLALTMPMTSVIPVQHGMPVKVEVETEKVLPVELVLRAAGKIVSRAPE